MYQYLEENDSNVNMADVETTEPSTEFSKIGLRILMAVMLFFSFVFLDISGIQFFSVDANEIYQYLQENYTVNSFAFIEEITYTLTHG